MNKPVKCAYCKEPFPPKATPIRAAGSGNGIAWVCDPACQGLYLENRDKTKGKETSHRQRYGRTQEEQDIAFHGD